MSMEQALFDILDKIFWCNFILFIWFHTDAFTQYLSFVPFFKIKQFKDYKFLNPGVTYPNFILLKYESFITKLLSCPPCLLFWLVLFFSHIYHFSHFALVYIFSYVIYRLLKRYVF